MWREVWDPTVSHIYKETLSEPFVRHGEANTDTHTYQNLTNRSSAGFENLMHTLRSKRFQNTSSRMVHISHDSLPWLDSNVLRVDTNGSG